MSCGNLGQDVVQSRVMIERGESLEMRASPEHYAGMRARAFIGLSQNIDRR